MNGFVRSRKTNNFGRWESDFYRPSFFRFSKEKHRKAITHELKSESGQMMTLSSCTYKYYLGKLEGRECLKGKVWLRMEREWSFFVLLASSFTFGRSVGRSVGHSVSQSVSQSVRIYFTHEIQYCFVW